MVRMLRPNKEDVKMDDEEKKLASFLKEADDENFVYLTGEKGTVIVNKKDIIAIKQ